MDTPNGRGTVIDINILKETVKVRVATNHDNGEIADYPLADIRRIHQAATASKSKQPVPAEDTVQEDTVVEQEEILLEDEMNEEFLQEEE